MSVTLQRIENMRGMLLFLCLGFGSTCCRADETESMRLQSNASSATIQSRVLDGEEMAIADATIEVLKWTGSYDRFGAVAVSDVEGRAELTFPYSDDYFYLLFKAKGYASSMCSLQISAGETQQIEFRLSPTVRPWLGITADGQPLAGAEVSMIEFVDRNQSTVSLQESNSKDLGFEFSKSDEAGRLELPTLPQGAALSIWVVHPERRTTKLEGMVAAGERLANVELETGVPVTVKLSGESQDIAALEGLKAEIRMLPSTGGGSSETAVRHEFSIRDGLIRFTASAVDYDELRFRMDGYFSTPLLMNYAEYPMPELNLTDGQPATLELKLRPKVTTRGRVVDAQGKGISHAFVTGMIANNSEPPADSDSGELESGEADSSETPPTNPAWAIIKKWSRGGNGQTDSDGNFEIALATGAVKLEVIREGYFSSPPTTETVIADPATEQLPEMLLHPVWYRPHASSSYVSDESKNWQDANCRIWINSRPTD